MMMPKISVIMPVYNGEKYLSSALESVLAQDYLNKEIIVINDGSTDQTQKIIEQFGKEIISLQQENKGLGASRNVGIKLASGTHFAFLDHDDFWAKDKLKKQMQIFIDHQETDPLIFGQVQQFICPSLSLDEQKKIIVNQAVLPGYIAGTLLLSKTRFEQIGYFAELKQLGEFIDWYLRAHVQSIPITMLNEVMLHRRVHNNNMGRQLDLYKRSDYLRILKANLDQRRQQQLKK